MKAVRKRMASFGRFVFVLLILVFAFVFAMFQGGQVSWTIFYAILPFTLYSIALFFYSLKDLTVERTIQTPAVQNGERLVVSLAVRRKWRFPVLYVVVSEEWRDDGQTFLTGDKLNKIFILGFRKEVKWDYEIEQMPRGEHVMEGVSVELFDFFGWMRKKCFIPIKNSILVYPKTTDIHYAPIGRQYDRGTITSPFNIVKDTTLATGVRDYQTGDRVSWIHWKSFARTQTLMTKEFEDRRSQELFVVLDGRPSESFEEQVAFAASILKEAAAQQVAVGFLSTGEDHVVFPTIQSADHFGQALIHLAKMQPVGNASTIMTESYGRTIGQSGSIILITGSPDWPFMESIARHVKNVRSIICFAAMGEEAVKRNDFARDVQLAKEKGITVHTLTQGQFSTAFKEVAR